jgi:hypothetical protein
MLWDCAFSKDVVAFEESAGEREELFKGKVGIFDGLNVFMDEVMTLLISSSLMSGVFLGRAEKKGFETMDEVVKSRLKPDGTAPSKGGKLMQKQPCKSVREEAERLLKGKKVEDNEVLKSKLLKLL